VNQAGRKERIVKDREKLGNQKKKKQKTTIKGVREPSLRVGSQAWSKKKKGRKDRETEV